MGDSAFLQIFPNGGGGSSYTFGPTLASDFSPNVVPYIDGSSQTAEDANFTYQSGQLGVGISSSLLGTIHTKGANDSSGYSLYAQSATYDVLRVGNNRSIVFGAGSAATNTDYTFNAYSASSTSNYVFSFIGASSDNIIRMVNAVNSTDAGVEILRGAASSGRAAITVYGSTTKTFRVMSNGSIIFPSAQAYNDSTEAYIMHSSTSGLEGMFFNVDASNADGFIFHKARTTTGYFDNKPFMLQYAAWQDSGASITGTNILNGWRPTYNYTGGGVTDVVALDYNPTLTAMNGTHYALKIRSGRNAFNLGASNSTAILHVKGTGAASGAPIKIDAATALGTPEDGGIERINDHLFYSQGTFRTQLDNDYDATPDTDHTSNGPTTNTILSGATITVMDLVYLGSGGKWLQADASVAATGVGALAISLESKNDTQAMRVALPGSFVRDDTWAWTVGATLYMSLTTAGITETAPSATDEVVRVIGHAVSADVIYFNPSPDYSTVV